MLTSVVANWKNVSLAFLDGFAPLDNLFSKPVRPGSEDDLIGTADTWSGDARLSGRQAEAYAAMRQRLVATIADLDSRFFPAPNDVASHSRR
jgi:hypothetical protein